MNKTCKTCAYCAKIKDARTYKDTNDYTCIMPIIVSNKNYTLKINRDQDSCPIYTESKHRSNFR